MPRYTITGVRESDGATIDVELLADTEKDALARSKENGVFPTKIKEMRVTGGVVSRRAFHAVDEPTSESTLQRKGRPLRNYGLSLLFAGFFCLVTFGLLYDTTVTTTTGGYFGEPTTTQAVHNIGKQQNRLLGFIVGIAAAGLGVVLLAIDTSQNSKAKGS